MYGVEITPSPNLMRILTESFDSIISQVLDDLTTVVVSIIKTPGYCPVDTGNLRDNHNPQLEESLVKYITNSVYYWVFVVYGHAVNTMKTPEAKRAFYRTGKSDRSKNKGVGFVPPNDYLLRSIVQAIKGGNLQKIVDVRVAQFLRGGG